MLCTSQTEASVCVLPWLAPGEQVCAMKDCIHVLPGEKKYHWKMYEVCRDQAHVGKDCAAGAVEREADATIPSNSELDVVLACPQPAPGHIIQHLQPRHAHIHPLATSSNAYN